MADHEGQDAEVLQAVNEKLAELNPPPLDAAIARALAQNIMPSRNGQGTASAVKELRSLIKEMEERSGEQANDGIDELAKARAARRSG